MCQRMLESVSKTIGVEYETIVFDNREKKYGICKAYNEATKEAKGDYLCFVHEDVVIKTNSWGKELVKFIELNNDCGVIGIAGGKYANRNFISWYVSENLIKIHDGVDSGKTNDFGENDLVYKYKNPNNEIFSRAICLDGVFLFVQKEIWENNKFDEEIFKGFHFYDADFTFSVSQKYQNYVYFGIDIYHFSKGNVERTYCENMYLFQKKWKNRLPYCLPSYKISFLEELRKANQVFSLYRKNNFSKIESFKRIYKINGILFSIFLLLKILKNRLALRQ
jgi:glycosyltransferase involved in cell wall biosynthesis